MTPLARQLADWRRLERPDDAACKRLFGVGLQTLQRIERGDVEPMPDLAERIGQLTALDKLPAASPTHGDAAPRPAAAAFHAAAGHFAEPRP